MMNTESHCSPHCADKHSALQLNDYRTQKNDANNAPWLCMLASEEYEQSRTERYKIEREFGEAKAFAWFRTMTLVGIVAL